MTNLILICLLGILTIAISVLGSQSNKRWHRNTVRIMGGISVILVVSTAYNAKETTDRLDKTIATLNNTSKTILDMSAETIRVGQLNTKLQERLLEQSKTITGLSKECIDTATGGDSFGYIATLNICSSDHWIPTFIQKGKYPLYGVTATIVDIAKFRKILESGLTWSNAFLADTVIDIGDTVEGHGRFLGKELPIARDGQEHAYNVQREHRLVKSLIS